MTRSGSPILYATAFALVVVVGLPLFALLLQAVFPEFNRGSFAGPFSRVAEVLGDGELPGLIANTLALGVSVMAGCLVLAMPLGTLRALFRVPGAALWDIVFVIPFMIPPYIAALAWVMTLQPRGYSFQLFGWDAEPFLFSFPGVVFVMVLNLFPLVYFATSRTLGVVGGRFASVGRVFGGTPLVCFFRITLPLAIPGLAASLLLVFALSIEEFGTPATLAARSGFDVMVTGIYHRFSDWPTDIPGAALLSVLLVTLAVCAYFVQQWIVTRRSYVAVTGKPVDFDPGELGAWRWPVVGLFALTGLVAVGVPVAAVLATALTATISGGLAADNVSLVHFAAIFDNAAGALDALGTSLSLAFVTAVVTAILGSLTALVVVRSTLRGRTALDILSVLPNALPGIVVAVGIILAWNQPWWPVSIYNTLAVLLLAYCCLLLPYPVRYATAAFRQIAESLDAAARVSGASFLRAFIRITAPLLAPNILAAMLLVFALASRELVASIMLAPAGTSTVSTFVFNQFEQGSPGIGMAMSVIAIFTTTAMLVVLSWWLRRVKGAGVEA